jgi:outer membrane lipoprotein-sorting protein
LPTAQTVLGPHPLEVGSESVGKSCPTDSSVNPLATSFRDGLTLQESGCYIQLFGHAGEFTLRRRHSIWMVSLAVLTLFACGCAVSKKTVVKPGQAPGPLLTATKADLIARYNQQAAAVTSLNSTVSMKLTAGSAYSGVIEQYHEVNGFILASRPASIRVIGQAPVVGKNVFDMVSDGDTFRIFIPSKSKFLEGKADLERPAKKPIENLRPQHLVDALLWTPIAKDTSVLFEEDNEPTTRYYVLTVISLPKKMTRAITTGVDSSWEIAQKIWFDRSDLNVARIKNFAPEGKVSSEVRTSDWEPAGAINYPRQIAISRPGDDYKLEITIKKITLNDFIATDRFVLEQPPGTDLVRVGEDTKERP